MTAASRRVWILRASPTSRARCGTTLASPAPSPPDRSRASPALPPRTSSSGSLSSPSASTTRPPASSTSTSASSTSASPSPSSSPLPTAPPTPRRANRASYATNSKTKTPPSETIAVVGARQ